MAKASASAVQAGYILESAWGVTPASPVQYFRATSATLKPVINTVTSEELRADGQVTDEVQVGASGTASYGYEFSADNVDDFLALAYRSSWATDTGLAGAQVGTDLLENGTTLRSTTLENYFSDIAQYARMTGARLNQISLSIANGERATGTMDFMGKVVSLSGSSVGTGAALDAPTADVLSAINVSSFTEGGSALEVLSFDFTISNTARLQPIVGTVATSLAGIGYGRFSVEGNLRVYFESATLINKFINHTASDFSLTIADAAGNTYVFKLPRVRYKDVDFPASGNDQDVTVSLPFRAVLDSASGKTLRTTRTLV